MTLSTSLLGSLALASMVSAQSAVAPRIPQQFPPSLDIKTAPEPGRAPDAPIVRPNLAPQSERTEPKPRVDSNAPIGRAHALDPNVMYYDAPGDGSLWARGAHYKTSFDAKGAIYFPGFGGCQPHNVPHSLSPDVVTIGGEPIAFDRVATPVRDGDRVEMDRGAFVESYDLAPQSVEQTFVFDSLPRAGDLVVHIPVASELDGRETDDGLEFQGQLGRVTYGRATAIDALGRRAGAATELHDGAITIRVGAEFLASAKLPLVIDPVVFTFPIDEGPSADDYSADAAFEAVGSHWLVVFEERFSATDKDVVVEVLDYFGTVLTGTYIDSSGDSWEHPRCAHNTAAGKFLCVASVTTGGVQKIRGRMLHGLGGYFGPQFDISGTEFGATLNADVGGDSFFVQPSYFCVTYERVFSSSDRDILVRLVDADGNLVGTGPTYLSNSGLTLDVYPSVSKSARGSTWVIAWQRTTSGSSGDIWAGRVSWDGSVLSNPFQITSNGIDRYPSASSMLDVSQTAAISFQRSFIPDDDIMIAVLDAANVQQVLDLSVFENDGLYLQNQGASSIDSDGQHFDVMYSEQFASSGTDYDIYVTDLYLSGSFLGLSQTHVNLAFTGLPEFGSSIASADGSGGPDRRFLCVWDKAVSSTDHDVRGALFDGNEGGPVSGFCFGDGSGGTCPCGNYGASGHGCGNSIDATGAQLTSSGGASVIRDSFVLGVHGVPPTSQCTFFQGTSANSPTVFGDGLRCAGGTTIRLRTVAASGGIASYPGPTDPHISSQGLIPFEGATRVYQVSYRNAAAFCTSATFNISNGLSVVWAH